MKGSPVAVLFSLLGLAAGCRNALPVDGAGTAGSDDSESSADGDADADSETATSTSPGTDTGDDTGSDPGTDSDTPGDTDTGTATDTGTDGDTDWDTESDTAPVPCIYECVDPFWSCGERGSWIHTEMYCPEEGQICCEYWKYQDEWPCLICSEPFPSHSDAPADITRAFPGFGLDPARLTPRGK